MRKSIVCILLAVVVASCSKDTTTDMLVSVADEHKIYVSFGTDEDRVQLNRKLNMVWTEGDQIYVIGPETQKKYLFDGKTGDRSGTFTCTETLSPLSIELDRYYAVAPYASHSVMTSEGKKRVRLHSLSSGTSTQEYSSESSGAVDTNLVFATSDDGKNFTFTSVIGYLRVSLTGEKVVKSIELSNNNTSDYIAGEYFFYIDDPNDVIWVTDNKRTTTILLDCKDGVQLSDTPTDFYFAIVPMTLTKGISINVNFTDGTSFQRSTSNAITISRNTIQPMALLSTSDMVYQVVKVTHSNNTFYMPTITGEAYISAGYVEWGDGVTSLLDALTSYDYIDNKESHTVTIKMRNADKIEFDSCKNISEINFSQF